MATTRLMTRHTGSGMTIMETLKDGFDYGKNPDKTRNGDLILAYECDPATADAEFLLSKAKYKSITGREQKRENDVLYYQIRQSFPPDETDPETALKISYDLAMRWTKGQHAFLWFPMLTAPTRIAIFTTIPPRWIAPESSGILSVQLVRCGGSLTGYALKTDCLLSPIPNATARENSNTTGNGWAVTSRRHFKRN